MIRVIKPGLRIMEEGFAGRLHGGQEGTFGQSFGRPGFLADGFDLYYLLRFALLETHNSRTDCVYR